jgi:hypothetical protein
VFLKQNSSKASIIYDLRECQIKGNYIRENMEEISKRFMRMRKNYNSFVRLFTQKELEKAAFYKQRRFSFATIKCIQKNEPRDDIIHPKEHLNLIIDIEHPYQQKLMMKGVYIFETLEFYKILKHQMKNFI